MSTAFPHVAWLVHSAKLFKTKNECSVQLVESNVLVSRLLIEKEDLLSLATDVFDLTEVSHQCADQERCSEMRITSYWRPLKPGPIV